MILLVYISVKEVWNIAKNSVILKAVIKFQSWGRKTEEKPGASSVARKPKVLKYIYILKGILPNLKDFPMAKAGTIQATK